LIRQQLVSISLASPGCLASPDFLADKNHSAGDGRWM
jgi:hypothetical protein